MAGWKTYKIEEVVSEISDQAFVLPVVQRRFVWEPEKIELLFDTILKGDAFGGIMVLEEPSGQLPLFESRPFARHGERLTSLPTSSKLAKKTMFVIDGQQRLQSLYIGLIGRLDAGELFFDLLSDHKTFFDFRFATDEKSLPATVRKNDESEKRTIQGRCWYRVATLFDRIKRIGDSWSTVADDVVEEYGRADKAMAAAIRTNIAAFWTNIFSKERLGVDSVSLNSGDDPIRNRQRVVELFRRLNDGGTPLSAYDLFASLLKGFNWKMEKFLDELLVEHGVMGLTQDNLIKLVFLLQGDAQKEMDGISASDADFAVQKQSEIKDALKLTQTFLEAAKLKDYFTSGNRSFIPLFFIAYYLFFKGARQGYFDDFDTRHPDFKPMRDWVFHSLLNSSFKSRGVGWNPAKTGIANILRVMEGAKGKPFPMAELLKIYKDHLHSFTTAYRPEDLDRLDRDFTFYIIYDCQRPISSKDIDHIQPRSLLEEQGVVSEKINSISNFQLLDPGTNRGPKNDSPFDAWFNGSSPDGANVADKPGFLERHLIPTDPTMHRIEQFDRLLTERAKLIAKKLNGKFQS
jgi:hypothetical protein